MRDAITVWLFHHFEIDSSLAGDLLEECASGRSAGWYWAQVLRAVLTSIWRPIRSHKLLTLRAIAVGCGANAIWFFLWSRFLPVGMSSSPGSAGTHTILSLSLIFITQFVTGYLIARTHRAHALSMVIIFSAWLLVWFVGDNLSDLTRLVMDSLDQPRFRPYLAWYLVPILIEQFGLLFGGLMVRPSIKSVNG